MADLGLPEFTFGFAFLYEQTWKHWRSLRGFPLLPSLQDEKKLAWDAMLPTVGSNYYYQFKRSELLQRKNAKHISMGPYHAPYFRFNLHKANFNLQHRLLWEHAQILGNQNTYYVAPELTSQRQFRIAFSNHTVSDESRLIPLRSCQNYLSTDKRQHYITYQKNIAGFRQYSEPYEGEGDLFGRDLGKLFETGRKDFIPIDEKYSNSFLKKTIQSVEKVIREYKLPEVEEALNQELPETLSEELLQAAKLLSVTFGITTSIVGDKNES